MSDKTGFQKWHDAERADHYTKDKRHSYRTYRNPLCDCFVAQKQNAMGWTLLIAGPNCIEAYAEAREKAVKTIATDLLHATACPMCDGSGDIAVRTGSRQYVTREMAIDAGDRDLEGSLYSDDTWEVTECQWCHDKKKFLASAPADKEVKP